MKSDETWYRFELSDYGTNIAHLKDFEAGTNFSTIDYLAVRLD
ncbi:MAG: hypothetical protein QM426_02430 [Euryarchaeota archaeon]|nr:hypothetical protein [Euryarchaeota archaeon]